MGKRGQILVENVIFLVLNLIFLSILVVFLINQGSSSSLLEDSYAKNIALLIDSARPTMQMRINMEDAYSISKKNEIDFKDVVNIKNNYVLINLDGTPSEYHFFNNIKVDYYPDTKEEGFYVFSFSKK